MTRKSIFIILAISLIVSLILSALTTILSENDPTGLSASDKFYATLMYAAVIYCFVFVAGGLISTLTRLFTNNPLIILVFFLIIGVLLFFINPWLSSQHAYLYIVGSICFGLLDLLSLVIFKKEKSN